MFDMLPYQHFNVEFQTDCEARDHKLFSICVSYVTLLDALAT